MKLNPGQLLERHKVPILAAGAGVAVIAALAKRSKDDGDPARVYPTATGAYDSTATDVYNSIWPQIEALQRSIAELAPADARDRLNPRNNNWPRPARPQPDRDRDRSSGGGTSGGGGSRSSVPPLRRDQLVRVPARRSASGPDLGR